MKIFLVLTILLLTLSCAGKKVAPSTEFLTFWGGFKRIAKPYWHYGSMKKLEVQGVLNRPLPVHLTKRNFKAPLIILIPGVFGLPDGIIVPEMIDALEKKNTHLLVLPSFISETYLLAKNTDKNSDTWLEEANVQKKLVQAGINLIGADQVTSISVVAESLGVWQAIMLLESDWNFASFFLLSPPLNLTKAVDRFDVLLEKNRPIFEDCAFWWKWPLLFGRYYQRELPVVVDETDNRCYGAMGIQSFTDGLSKISKNIYKDRKSSGVEPKSFRAFVENVTPEYLTFFGTDQNKLKLYYWKAELLKRTKKLRLISAMDDFLNNPMEWEDFLQDKDFKDLLTLYPHGGHSGEIGQAQFWPELNPTLVLE